MFDDKYSAERMPGFNPEEEKRGEYADVWEEANMEEDAPEFQGEDPYNPKNPDELEEEEAPEKEAVDRGYGGAEKLTSYGLDTAARIYGLDTVLKAVEETDETDRDALNPMGSIYERLAPSPEEREFLFDEMDKDDDEEQKAERKTDEPEDVNNAIRQMKKILDALENDPRFEDVRQRAADEGKDVISYLVSGEVNPTITTFFDGLDAASGGSVEEILDEIEQEEKEKQKEELNEKIENGEPLNPEMLQ